MFKKLLFRISILVTMLASLAVAVPGGIVSANSGFYQETKLVSDLPNVAMVQDKNLVNAWGLSHPPTGPWWVSDNGTGVSTLYNGQGQPFPVNAPLVVSIPMPDGTAGGAVTGNVFNDRNSIDTKDFVVTKNNVSGPSLFLFATEDGTISGWNRNVDATNAVLAVNRSSMGAVYKGLAIAHTKKGNFLYASNFNSGWVDMFDSHFKLVRSFTDKKLEKDCPMTGQCYAPFGIQNINGWIYVTYALQDAKKHDDVSGAGNGFVDIFNTEGKLVRRFAAHGKLNSPWGMVMAPKNFGRFSGDLLVGNFGDGHITAFNPKTGACLGQLRDKDGMVIEINGLWGIAFGNGAAAGPTNTLFFASGLNDEANGLFGMIEAKY